MERALIKKRVNREIGEIGKFGVTEPKFLIFLISLLTTLEGAS